MSIRFHSYADRLGYNATPPPPAPNGFTITGWIYASAGAGEDGYTVFQLSSNHDGVTNSQFELGTQLNENQLGIITVGGGVYVTDPSLAVGQWYWFAARIGIQGTANEAEVDLGGPGNFTLENFSRGSIDASGTPTDISVGGQMPSEENSFWNGRLAYMRVWSTALTDAEVIAEVQSTTPVRTANLWADWPLLTATDLTDHSGNGHDLSGGTNLTTEDDPPISVQNYTPVITSSVGIADVASDVEARSFHGLVQDQVSLTDVVEIALVRQFAGTITDAIGVTDVVDPTQSTTEVTGGNVGITDAVIASQGLQNVVNSAVGIHESMTTWLDAARTIDESLGVTDDVEVVLTRHYLPEITDAIGVNDIAATARSVSVELTESIAVHDVASDVDARSFHGLILDQVGVTDVSQYLLQRHFIVEPTDALGVTDDVTHLRVGRPHETITDAIGLTDELTVGLHASHGTLLRIRVSGMEPGRR